MQTVSHLNKTLARSSLKDTFNTIRQSFRQQTRKQTVASAGTSGAQPESQSAFAKLWNSPVGPKTVHFWAPIAKWGVVLAGVSDLFRPASVLSLQQNLALMATGMIWTRWCFIIKPKNMFLATVNFFLFCNGLTQVTRVLMYRSQQNQDSLTAELGKAAKEEGGVIADVVRNPEASAKTAEEKARAGK